MQSPTSKIKLAAAFSIGLPNCRIYTRISRFSKHSFLKVATVSGLKSGDGVISPPEN